MNIWQNDFLSVTVSAAATDAVTECFLKCQGLLLCTVNQFVWLLQLYWTLYNWAELNEMLECELYDCT